jgi:hypothetical protein
VEGEEIHTLPEKLATPVNWSVLTIAVAAALTPGDAGENETVTPVLLV